MIVGKIDTFDKNKEPYPKIIKDALEYLKNTDFKNLTDGRYDIKGDKCYANLQRYNTKLIEDCHPESHELFVDIQYMVEGEEYLGWCPFNPDLKKYKEYSKEKDVTFYTELVPESNIVLSTGSFVVLYPEDVHRPCCAVDGVSSAVTKVVVKISVDLL